MKILDEFESGMVAPMAANRRQWLFVEKDKPLRVVRPSPGCIVTRFVDTDGKHHLAELAVSLEAAADKAWAGVQLVDTLRALRAWRKGWFELQARQWGFPEAAINAAIWRSMETGRPISMEQVNATGDLQLYVGAELLHTAKMHPASPQSAINAAVLRAMRPTDVEL